MKQYIIILICAAFIACDSQESSSDAFGNFEATEVFIAAENPGKIIHFPVNQGQEIQKGETLAIIDTTQLYLKRGQARAAIRALRNKLSNVPIQLQVYSERQEVLEREVKRVQSLLEDGAASQKQFDDLTGELQVVEKQKAALESQLSTANRGTLAEIEPLQWQIRQIDDQIVRSTVLSPISGTILESYKTTGEIAMAGQPLIKMAELKHMELRVYIDASLLTKAKVGQSATVLIDGPDGNMLEKQGKIIWVSPQAEFTPKVIQTKNERVNLVYALKLRVENDGSLKIGMPAEVQFN